MRRLLIVLLLLPLFHASAYASGLADQTLSIFDTTQMENGLSTEEREIGGKIDLSMRPSDINDDTWSPELEAERRRTQGGGRDRGGDRDRRGGRDRDRRDRR